MKIHVKGVGLDTSTIELTTTSSSTSDTLKTLELVSKYTTLTNQEVALPETITAIFSNGTSQELPVRWDLSGVDYTTPGTYTIKGMLEGYAAAATATIYVYDEFAGAQDYSTVMHEGDLIQLPSTRHVYYHNGTIAQEFPVTWNYYDSTTFKAGQTYTIEGSVVAANQHIPVVANIRVVEALAESRNLARLESDLPALSESCTTPADNLASLNNGVKVSTSATERWTDYNDQQNKKPWVSYQWQNAYTISDIIAYIYQDATSCVPRTLELELEALNDQGDWVSQEISYITPVAYLDGDGKTTINLKTPVTTNAIRLSLVKLEAGTYTGLTELEVFEYIPRVQADDNSTITDLKINGSSIEGFDSNTTDYKLNVKEYPDFDTLHVTVEGVANTATYMILKDAQAHQIRVIVRAENGTERMYTVSYLQSASKTALQELYDRYVNEVQGIYTEDSWQSLQDALAYAKEVLDDDSADAQAVQKAVTTLQSAITGLKKQRADYTKVDNAIANVPKDLSIYTPESVKVLQDALAGVIEGKAIDEQEIVDGYAQAIEAAIQGLVLRQGKLVIDQLDPELAQTILDSIPKELKKKIEDLNAQGIDVSIAFEVKAVEEADITEEVKTALLRGAREHNLIIGAYYDVSISLQAKGEWIGTLTELNKEIPMELVIPLALRKAGRSFSVIRLHDDEVNILTSMEEAGVLKFSTDRFSMYAIAYEKVKDTPPTPPIPDTPTPDVPDNPTPDQPDNPMPDVPNPTPSEEPDQPSPTPSVKPEEPKGEAVDQGKQEESKETKAAQSNTSPNTGDSSSIQLYGLLSLITGAYIGVQLKRRYDRKRNIS